MQRLHHYPLLLVALLLCSGIPAAWANHRTPFDGSMHSYGEMVDYELTFPVIGTVSYRDTFSARRGAGEHHAQDLMAAKMTPVVAAASGTVRYINWSRDPDDLNPDRCCTLVIRHDDNWETWYIHLNNDSPGTDDGLGWGIAPGITVGSRVRAGDLIGWVGDSGNAENVSPHLHFELYDPEDVIVNPYEALRAAQTRITQRAILEAMPEGLGLVDPASGRWYLGGGTLNREPFYFGNAGDVPLIGDWDCDGDDTPGMYRQSDGFVYLRNTSNQGIADVRFFFGRAGDLPVAGDFDGDECDTVSVYRPAEGRVFIINELGSDGGSLGAAEFSYYFGLPGDKPFAGDFDGDGVDTIGLHRESTGFVYFRNSHTQGVADVDFFFGIPQDRFVTGDWDEDGLDSPGVYRPGDVTFYLRYANTQGVADEIHTVGQRGWLPVAGDFWAP